MNNLEIADLLKNVSAAYQYKDPVKYKFQSIAYERAATSIEHLTSELKDLWDEGKLDQVPGIGPSIAKHLDEIFKTGKSSHFEKIMQGIPSKAFVLMALPKVGLKTAMKMIKELSEDQLDKQVKEAEKILKTTKRQLLPYAIEIADQVVEYLKKDTDVLKVETLGSLRRKLSTVGDIDIVVSTQSPISVINHFVKYPKANKIIEKGEKTASILLPADIQVDLLAVKPQIFGSALQHFTGSKHHNIALREFALRKGFSLSEYGIKDLKTGKTIEFETETSFYQYLGLEYIRPELREDMGEIEAALNGSLLDELDLSDIKSDLQIHSNFDIETSHDLGQNSIAEIAQKAITLKYEYIALTEHNPSKKGHSMEQVYDILARKREYVDQFNYSREKRQEDRVFKVFNSLEIDIGKDGSLPIDEKSFSTLDFALVSIHSNFELGKTDMTKRIIRALEHPKVKIFAHPTARKINQREGVEINWPEVFEYCLKHNKWVEVNADPMRLDLPDFLVREAVKAGVKITLGTDTHDISMMDNMKFGLWTAMRGWAQKKDIINTRSLIEFEKMINL